MFEKGDLVSLLHPLGDRGFEVNDLGVVLEVWKGQPIANVYWQRLQRVEVVLKSRLEHPERGK